MCRVRQGCAWLRNQRISDFLLQQKNCFKFYCLPSPKDAVAPWGEAGWPLERERGVRVGQLSAWILLWLWGCTCIPSQHCGFAPRTAEGRACTPSLHLYLPQKRSHPCRDSGTCEWGGRVPGRGVLGRRPKHPVRQESEDPVSLVGLQPLPLPIQTLS